MADPFELVQDVLDARESLLAEGKSPDLRSLCRDDSSLLREVEAALDDLERGERLLGPLEGSVFPPALSYGTALRIVRVLGLGGQGRVYLARDESLHRDVVVKASHWTHAAAVLRIKSEAEIAARLDHPGAPSVLGSGTTAEGVPYFVMRYVRGKTLEAKRQELDEAPDLSSVEAEAAWRRLLSAVVAAARTVEHAHQRGILHCDLKPQNILVGDQGETLVLDWGAAVPFKRGVYRRPDFSLLELSHSATLRKISAELRTPCYVAPERGQPTRPIGTYTDVYGLGAILARLIGLPLPSASEESTADRPHAVALNSALRFSVRRELTSIADAARRERPEERTASAAVLADAVERTLKTRRLLGRPFGFWTKVFRLGGSG